MNSAPEQPVPTSVPLWPGLCLALVALAVFAWTAYPTVAGGDSGELVAAACSLGVAHPPGYPLFTLLGQVFSWLPFGTVAWRVNLLSAASTAGAVFFLYLTVRRLTRWWPAAFLAAGAFAFAPLVWRYSTQAEVFALNNLFAAGLLYLALRAASAAPLRPPYLFALVAGLGLANHHTLVFVVAPLGLWLLWQTRSVSLRPAALLGLVGSGLLGLTPYLYLMLASSRVPLVSWGDLTSVAGFVTHVLRQDYGTFKLASAGVDSGSQLLPGLGLYGQDLARQLLYVGLIPVALGVVRAFRGRRPLELACLLIPVGYLLFFHALANLPFVDGPALYRGIVSRFWLMPHVLVFVLLGTGWLALRDLRPGAGQLLAAVAVAAVGIQGILSFPAENQHTNRTFERLGEDLLRPVPAGGLLLTLGDVNTNAVRYLQACEGVRPDVAVLDRSIMGYPWARRIIGKYFPAILVPGLAYHPAHPDGYDLASFFEANLDEGPVFLTAVSASPDVLESRDTRWTKDFVLLPYGLAFRVIRTTEPIDIAQYLRESEALLPDVAARFPVVPPGDSWERFVYDQLWQSHYERASMILKLAALDNLNPQLLQLSGDLLAALLAKHAGAPGDWYKDLGISRFQLALKQSGPEAAENLRAARDALRIYVDRTSDRDSATYRQIEQLLATMPAT